MRWIQRRTLDPQHLEQRALRFGEAPALPFDERQREETRGQAGVLGGPSLAREGAPVDLDGFQRRGLGALEVSLRDQEVGETRQETRELRMVAQRAAPEPD